jgi:hypothetical protein
VAIHPTRSLSSESREESSAETNLNVHQLGDWATGLRSREASRSVRREEMFIAKTLLNTPGPHISWIKNHRSWFVSRTRPCSLRLKMRQLMSEHSVLCFKPQLRLDWRGQDGQNETVM